MSDAPIPPARPRRVGVISLGCAKNLVDTEVMLGYLGRAGCEFVSDPAEAELILINTCGFIESAREESVQTIVEAAELKRSGRLERLVVAGCLVQRHRAELERSLPEVDAFVDLDELGRIVERAGLDPIPREDAALPASDLPILPARAPARRAPAASAVAAWSAATYLYDDATPRRLATPRWTAYVKIAEGCDHSCAFCAIPTFRGRLRSRRPESVVREAEALARQGVREINLVAQDSSHYGRDLGLDEGLAGLLARLQAIDGLAWIRVHYLYPNTITDRLLETMAALPKVVKYVDLPLQHADRETLRRMRRGGSVETHLELLARIRAILPEVSLRTTFLVGFPGETEREFATLLGFVDAARFDHVGVFAYSHEERTSAFDLADDVPGPLKEERRARLLERQQPVAFARQAAWVGRRLEVLVEGCHPETEQLLVGRTRGQAPDVDAQVLIQDGVAAPGEIVGVEITGTAGYDLVGAIRGPA